MKSKGTTSLIIKRLLNGDSLIGKQLVSDQSNRYSIVNKIGEGGMGAVYEGFDSKGNKVAVKVALVDQGMQRFRLETVSLKLLGKNPYLPELIDWGLDRSEIKFCVMEYIAGETLEQVINKKRKWFYKNRLYCTIEIATLLLTALHHTHNKKVIHRDIKPANIIVSPDSNDAVALKLMDFGVAKTLEKGFLSFLHRKIKFDEKTLTLPGQPLGTLGYAPREQIDNNNPRETADIFACGVTIMEMLRAGPLMHSKTISEYMAKLEAFAFEPVIFPSEDPYVVHEINRIAEKALAKEPRQRYLRAGKMLKELSHLKQHVETTKNNPL